MFVKSRYRTALMKRESRSTSNCFYKCDKSTRRRCTRANCKVPVCSEHSDQRNLCIDCNRTDLFATFLNVPCSSEKQGRCRICPSRGKVSRTVCDSCKRFVCADHHKKIIWCVCHKTEKVQNRLLLSSSSSGGAPKLDVTKKALVKNPTTKKKSSKVIAEISTPTINKDQNHETLHEPAEAQAGSIPSPILKCSKCRTSTRRTCGNKECGVPVCGKCSKKYIVCGEYPPKSNRCYSGLAQVTSSRQGRCALCDRRGKVSQTNCDICRRFLCLPHRIIKVQCHHHDPPEVFKLRRRRRINIKVEPEPDPEPKKTTTRTFIKFDFRKKNSPP